MTKLLWLILTAGMLNRSMAQIVAKTPWIRPDNAQSPPVWGIRGGLVVGLWPAAPEIGIPDADGGPRGLLRIGFEYKGRIHLINYIAVEPVVDGDMEFSEVSPSRVDGRWGKLFWAADTVEAQSYSPHANTRGIITHPDPLHPETEQLSFYVFMEQFLDGAHPYLKLTISSDRPGELGIEIFHHSNSAVMQRCALTATMGNYSRLRLLYLKDKVIDSRKLFAGYDDIEFAEKQPYSLDQLFRGAKGDYLICAESNETFNELSAWPQQAVYLSNWAWRYRPFYKLTQYWRIARANADPSLVARVNGRAKYWAGDSHDPRNYMPIPGGPAFENFELRENYHPGQKFYFGLSLHSPKEVMADFITTDTALIHR